MNCQIYKGPPYVPVKSVDLVGWPHKYQKDLSWRISTANPLLLEPKCSHLTAFQLGLETDPKTTHSGMKTKGSFYHCLRWTSQRLSPAAPWTEGCSVRHGTGLCSCLSHILTDRLWSCHWIFPSWMSTCHAGYNAFPAAPQPCCRNSQVMMHVNAFLTLPARSTRKLRFFLGGRG